MLFYEISESSIHVTMTVELHVRLKHRTQAAASAVAANVIESCCWNNTTMQTKIMFCTFLVPGRKFRSTLTSHHRFLPLEPRITSGQTCCYSTAHHNHKKFSQETDVSNCGWCRRGVNGLKIITKSPWPSVLVTVSDFPGTRTTNVAPIEPDDEALPFWPTVLVSACECARESNRTQMHPPL